MKEIARKKTEVLSMCPSKKLAIALCVVAFFISPLIAANGNPRVAVVIGQRSPAIEHYAASQLCSYLDKLFGVEAVPVTHIPDSAQVLFLVGTPKTNEAVRRVESGHFPRVSGQGIVLAHVTVEGHPALVVSGGSPAATLWAVYELAERGWGVHYMLHGDVLPKPGYFYLPHIDVAENPVFPVRQWRVVNELAFGPISWGMAQYRPVIDQLAKMKFNRLLVALWPHQPFADYSVGGIKRRSATIFFGFHFLITDDMVGRSLFGNAKEFWNPDLPVNGSYQQLTAAFERLVRNIIDYGHQRGMKSVLSVSLTQFPPEFAPLLKGSKTVHQLHSLTVGPNPNTSLDDPMLTKLSVTVLRALVNTYPEADGLDVQMPEHRQWVGQYKRAWKALDNRYGISKVSSLPKLIYAARHRPGNEDGPDRAEAEVKGDIVSLYFLDRLFNDEHVLRGTQNPHIKIIYDGVAEELLPLMDRILPPGSEMLDFIDYTPPRILKRREVLREIPTDKIPNSLIYTLQDDNVGVLPQLGTKSFYGLTQDLQKYGWAGFSTRYWLIGDHDPALAYIARASWERGVNPEEVDHSLLKAVCGPACADDMMSALHNVEVATIQLDWYGSSLAFPVPGMMMKHWKATPMPAEWVQVREVYRHGLEAAQRARKVSNPQGRHYVDYWIGRLEFGIHYLDTVEAVHRAAMAEAQHDKAQTLKQAQIALKDSRLALEAYAGVAGDQSDRGAIAMMNEYVYRPLKAKVAELGGN